MLETKGSILIVDDEESIRDVISRGLQKDGYDCVMASDGTEALETVSKQSFDLVLLDIKMPGVSGIEVLSQIMTEHPDTCVIMATAVADGHTAVEAMKMGALDYITKPLNMNDLSFRVEQTLEKKRLIQENRNYKIRLAEQALRESEDNFKRLSEAMSDGYFIVQDCKLVFANEKSAEILGFTPGEIIGKTAQELLPGDLFEGLANVHKRRMKGEDVPVVYETLMPRKDGTKCPAELGVKIMTHAGKSAVSVVMRDITERKQSEAVLRESEGKFRSISEQSLVGIGILQNGKFIYTNGRVSEITGYTQEEMLEWSDTDFVGSIYPEDRRFVVEQALKKQQGDPDAIPHYSCRINTKSGDIKWIENYSNNITYQGIPAYVMMVIDITDRKKAEDELQIFADELLAKNQELDVAHEELAVLNRELEQRVERRTAEVEKLLKQRDGLIDQLGHDLKSPLTPLITMLPIVRKQESDPNLQETLDVCIGAVNYMKELVAKTLRLAKLNSSHVEFCTESVTLKNEVGRVITGRRSLLSKRSVNIENKIKPSIVVETDRQRLGELLDNLTTNAANFTPRGGTITYEAKQSEDIITVSVKDTGFGMTEEQLSHVFDEFYKADEARSDLNSPGLGLTICKRIVEKQGGKIWAESPGLGKGATFCFTFKAGKKKSSSRSKKN